MTINGVLNFKDKNGDVTTVYPVTSAENVAGISAALAGKVDKETGKGLSTEDFTTVEKNKLSGIEPNANNYVHPVTGGWRHVPSGGTSGQILGWAADGTAQWVDNSGGGTEYSDATPTAHGLMSATDKSKLDGIASGATAVHVDSELSNTSTNPVQNKVVYSAVSDKVDKVTGKGLSTNDFTDAEKSKLSGIAEGAEVNVQADWNQATSTADDYIKNKPSLGTAAAASASDFATAAQGIKADNAIPSSAKGTANGVAELDSNGLVPTSQLPSYVDSVVEYASASDFPVPGENEKIYVAIDTNLSYRWSGSAYVEISPSLALGTTESTAYRGDRGQTAYEHATDASRLTTAKTSGLYKIAATAEGHVASATPVTKSDITALGIPAQDTTYLEATTSASGLMSASDKSKLNGIEAQANKTIISTSVPSTPTDSTVPSMKLVADTYAKNSDLISGLNEKADTEQIAYFDNDLAYTKTVFNGITFYYSIIPISKKPELITAHNTVNAVQNSIDMAAEAHATIATNAGLFNMSNYTTLGIVVQDGEVKSKYYREGTKQHLYMDSDGYLHALTATSNIDADIARLDLSNTKWCVSGWGTIIDNHAVVWQDTDGSPKSVIGQADNGDYIVIITDGREWDENNCTGLDICNFIESIGFNARILYQMDGGGSVCFSYMCSRINKLIRNEDRPIANMIAWGLKKDADDDFYLALAEVAHQNVRARRTGIAYSGGDCFKVYSDYDWPGVELYNIKYTGDGHYDYPRIGKIGIDKENAYAFFDAELNDSYQTILRAEDSTKLLRLYGATLNTVTGEFTLRNNVKVATILDILPFIDQSDDVDNTTNTSIKSVHMSAAHNPIGDTAAVITFNASDHATHWQLILDGFKLYIRNMDHDWVRISGAEPTDTFPSYTSTIDKKRHAGEQRFDKSSHKTYTFYDGVWYDAMGNPRE